MAAVLVQEFAQSGVFAWILALTIVKTLGFKALGLIVAAYVAHVKTDRSPFHLGRKNEWFRHHTLWKYFAGYFPASIKKTAELDPSKGPYVFGYHPHGIFVVGAIANFGEQYY
jgi:hypothetical protein